VDDLMDGLWVSAALIFVAELGDRSQLMALTLAARHRASTVLAGITLATAFVHVLSVAEGALIGEALPTLLIGVLAARIPARAIRVGATAPFVIVGVVMIIGAFGSART
jgi:putative Ca2+/H+ antiporter (TMEM165/GDT1 family)